MRFLNALKSDIRFQFKHGFYTIYAFLTIFYVILLSYIPQEISDIVAPLIILIDPSIVGFFFIGGILMLEKIQGVLDYIFITPLHLMEYLMAKVLSLTLIAIISSLIIAYGSGMAFQPITLILSLILISCSFTLLGFIVALKCETINQYFIKIVPSMILLTAPCLLLLFINDPWVIGFIPSIASIYLMLGAFHGIPLWETAIYVISLILFIFILMIYIKKNILSILYGGQ
ncbi:MAG: ABC transporter permease [Eubacteriales bacterium]